MILMMMIRTKHSTQSERHVEFLNVKPWWYVKKPQGLKRVIKCTNPSNTVFTVSVPS